MILLLLHLLEEETNTEELFGEVLFEQSIVRKVEDSTGKKVEMHSDLRLINADDFFAVLK